MVRLIVESGGAPRTVTFADVCRIGREPTNELSLDDVGASRKHCRITREGDALILEDLKSANGTFRNEERVDRVRLAEGDRIRIGQTVMRVELDDGPEEIELELPGAARSGYAVLFLTGERAGERFQLGARLTMGRKPTNTVIFTDAKVSGVHAELLIEDERAVLRDMGSTNGTFLEGKRVDEIVLDHGDRVSVGDNEFVLLDASRPEPDLSVGFQEDAERTIVDMPKVKVVRDVTRTPRSPLALVGLLLLIAGLAGAGWFYWSVDRKGRRVAAAPPAPGNMLQAGWSFESTDGEGGNDPSAGWVLGEGGEVAFELDAADAHSGGQSLMARVDGAPAIATHNMPLTITTRSYKITGHCRCSGATTGLLVALFTPADNPDAVTAVPVGSATGPEWVAIEREVHPPADAKRLRLQLIAAGGKGEVRFDDLGVFEGGISQSSGKTINQFEFERVGPTVIVRRGGDEMMRVQPLVFGAPGGGEYPVDRFLVGADTGSVVLRDGLRIGYAAALDTDARTASWRVEWKDVPSDGVEQVTLPIRLVPPLTDEAVGVLLDGRHDPYRESFAVDRADGLILGMGPTRMRIGFDPPVAITGRQGGDRFDLLVRPGTGAGRLLTRMQVDFIDEKAKAKELIGQARDSEARGELGQALAILDRIGNEFPFDEGVLADANARRTAIMNQRGEMAKRVREAAERAAFLQSPAAYTDAEREAAEAVRAFDGTPVADEFEVRRKDLAAERETRLREADQREADLLLERLRTAQAQNPPHEHVAMAVRKYLVARFPWSEAARRAAEEK